MIDHERRWIRFEACRNFRDLGGYRTREGAEVRLGRLYRSAALGAMSENDVRLATEELGLRTIVDLRHPGEAEQYGRGPLLEAGVAYVNLSLNRDAGDDPDDPAPDLARLDLFYLWKLRGEGGVLASILRLLADESCMPLVFHCAGGKDRTGIVAACILHLLGVPEDTIVADYALTERSINEQPREDLEAAMRIVAEQGLPEEVLWARPATMAGFLEGVHHAYGSLRSYLREHGVDDDLVEALRASLLEPSYSQG